MKKDRTPVVPRGMLPAVAVAAVACITPVTASFVASSL